jgi:CDP-2,3-bis-(O-geranylgeranyl)-sn-glycerol synthase
VDLPPALIALLLVSTANATPWLLAVWLGDRGAVPLDHGLTLPDGKRLLGAHKTWRGLLGGTLGCACAAAVTDVGFEIGAWFGMLALAGDAAASFVKRRIGLGSGSEVPGLDQLPEAVLPMWMLAPQLRLTGLDIVVAACAFLLIDVVTVRLRHRY